MTESAVPPTASVDRMDALKALREARLAMGSFDFRRAAADLDEEDRARLARRRLDVTAELRRLEAAALAEIAGALEARCEELAAATAETRAALSTSGACAGCSTRWTGSSPPSARCSAPLPGPRSPAHRSDCGPPAPVACLASGAAGRGPIRCAMSATPPPRRPSPPSPAPASAAPPSPAGR